jgi:hypothetical protein
MQARHYMYMWATTCRPVNLPWVVYVNILSVRGTHCHRHQQWHLHYYAHSRNIESEEVAAAAWMARHYMHMSGTTYAAAAWMASCCIYAYMPS